MGRLWRNFIKTAITGKSQLQMNTKTNAENKRSNVLFKGLFTKLSSGNCTRTKTGCVSI